MLEFYLGSARRLAQARSSPLGSYLDGFASTLREIGYCWRIGKSCITYAVHLGVWAAADDVEVGSAALDEGSGCSPAPR